MIKVTKIDNVWMKIEADNEGVLYELRDYFCFFIPNYKHMPAYKNGWDGQIKLFNPFKRTLYVGLLPYLKKFAHQFEYDLDVDSELEPSQLITPEELNEFLNGLTITKNRVEIKPRYYQKVGLYHMINSRRVTLTASTAAGKSLLAYLFAKWYLKTYTEGKIILIVPTTNLVEQMAGDFENYSQGTFQHNIHKIYSGKDKIDKEKRIFITTWQSVYELPKNYFDMFDVVQIDECHGAKASSLKGILEKSRAEFRHGLTGTMHDPEAHKWVIEGLLGKTVDLIGLTELMARKWIAQLKINCVMFDYPTNIKTKLGSLSYPDEIKFLIGCKERTKKILMAVGKIKENSFVLFDKIVYGKELEETIKKMYPDKKVYLVYGKTAVEDREIIRKALEHESGSIVIASYKVFSMGISIDNLHHLFCAEPIGKSKQKIWQSIGRSLRLHDDKDFATLWDFFDNLSNSKSKPNHTMRHFVSDRVMMYNKEGLEYKIMTVPLEVQYDPLASAG